MAFYRSYLHLLIEFALLCLVLPGIIIFTKSAPFMFAFLWGATLYCFVILRYANGGFEGYKKLWNWSAVNWSALKPIIIRWAIASVLMVIFLAFYEAERLFYLPLNKPEVMLYLMVFYPLVSALPQEFIFCTFLFSRYEKLFGDAQKMVMLSAVVFAYAHMLYINPVAPSLSLLGGLIFASTYLKHKSLALVTIEHGLYGYSLFVCGLGWYFYSGAVV